jgi:hypothetical protein
MRRLRQGLDYRNGLKMRAIKPSSDAVRTVTNKMSKALGIEVPEQLVRSSLMNAYEVDKQTIANAVNAVNNPNK